MLVGRVRIRASDMLASPLKKVAKSVISSLAVTLYGTVVR